MSIGFNRISWRDLASSTLKSLLLILILGSLNRMLLRVLSNKHFKRVKSLILLLDSEKLTKYLSFWRKKEEWGWSDSKERSRFRKYMLYSKQRNFFWLGESTLFLRINCKWLVRKRTHKFSALNIRTFANAKNAKLKDINLKISYPKKRKLIRKSDIKTAAQK